MLSSRVWWLWLRHRRSWPQRSRPCTSSIPGEDEISPKPLHRNPYAQRWSCIKGENCVLPEREAGLIRGGSESGFLAQGDVVPGQTQSKCSFMQHPPHIPTRGVMLYPAGETPAKKASRPEGNHAVPLCFCGSCPVEQKLKRRQKEKTPKGLFYPAIRRSRTANSPSRPYGSSKARYLAQPSFFRDRPRPAPYQNPWAQISTTAR